MKWRRQAPVLAYTVDFLCVSAKLIVELDGTHHAMEAAYDALAAAALRDPTAGPSPLPLSHSGEGFLPPERDS